MNKNTVTLFLGAGFSRGISGKGFPLTNNLLEVIKNSILSRDISSLRQIEELETEAELANSSQPFEEMLKIVTDNIERGVSVDDNKKLYRLLVNGVALATRFVHPGYEKYPDTEMELGKYIQVLQDISETSNLRIITTNYDLISDKSVQWINDRLLELDNKGMPPKDLRRFQYGFNVSGVWSSDTSGLAKLDLEYFDKEWVEDQDSLVQIYKLHGSSNWAACECCKELHLSRICKDLKEMFSNVSDPLCEKCGNRYRYSIIPPEPNKGINRDFILDKVWNKASESLNKSTHVIFIGYSLPDEDPLVRSLIKESVTSEKKYYVMELFDDVFEKYRKLLGKDIKEYNDGYSYKNLKSICEEINLE